MDATPPCVPAMQRLRSRVAAGGWGLLYMGGAVACLEVAFRLHQPTGAQPQELMHLTASPLVVGLTALFRHRVSLQQPHQRRRSPRQRLRLVAIGFGLGSGVYLTWVGLITAAGGATLPAWGWQRVTPRSVASAVALSTVGHLAVALNEEQVFRGYGCDLWFQALGPCGATTMLTTIFALAHRPTNLASISGFSMLSLVFMAFRVLTGDISLAVGYHWGWNLIQTGILGIDPARPSLRPVVVQTPSAWIGSRDPETGWLTTVLHGLVLIGVLRWRWHHGSRP